VEKHPNQRDSPFARSHSHASTSSALQAARRLKAAAVMHKHPACDPACWRRSQHSAEQRRKQRTRSCPRQTKHPLSETENETKRRERSNNKTSTTRLSSRRISNKQVYKVVVDATVFGLRRTVDGERSPNVSMLLTFQIVVLRVARGGHTPCQSADSTERAVNAVCSLVARCSLPSFSIHSRQQVSNALGHAAP
jgi:hypothetical protein